jgi:hypothetical protein
MARHIAAWVALCAAAAIAAPAGAQTPVDGQIVRVVYRIDTGGTWGFHLADMNDGRYCVRFGNPGRLSLAIIQRMADICFDRMPSTVDRSQERRSRAIDTADGRMKTIVSFQKGSIAATGDAVALDISTCNGVEGGGEVRCFRNRFVVHLGGQDCSAQVTLARGTAHVLICERYTAQ